MKNQNAAATPFAVLIHCRHFLTAVLLGCCLTACSASLIAPYDDKTDALLTELTNDTELAVGQADTGQLSAAAREDFYTKAEAKVRTMKIRAGLYKKNEDELGAIDGLYQRYQALHARNATPRTSMTTGLRATLLDLHQIQAAKKRSGAFSASLKKAPAAP